MAYPVLPMPRISPGETPPRPLRPRRVRFRLAHRSTFGRRAAGTSTHPLSRMENTGWVCLRDLVHLCQKPRGNLAFLEHFFLGFVPFTFFAFLVTAGHSYQARGLSRKSGHDGELVSRHRDASYTPQDTWSDRTLMLL